MSFRKTISTMISGALLVAFMLAVPTGCGGQVNDEVAVMETSLGEVVLGFYPDVAPNHVANFKRLATEDVYDNVLFHRVIPGFMVQTGDPGTADPDTPRNMYGMGGTDRNEPLMAEFSDTKHVRGTLAMARSKDPNSADSQFYIALNAVPHLDGSYTVFGQVLRGMEVIDSIAAVKTDMGDCPLEPIRIIDVKIMTKAEAGIE